MSKGELLECVAKLAQVGVITEQQEEHREAIRMRVDDFKKHIARIMRERETGKKWSIIGAARASTAVIRKRKRPENLT